MKRLLAMLLALSLLLALCGCGGSAAEQITEAAQEADTQSAAQTPAQTPQEPAQEPAQEAAPQVTGDVQLADAALREDLPGTYKMTAMTGGETQEDEDAVAQMEAMGIRYFLVMNPDGTGYMDVLGEHAPLRWDNEQLYLLEDEEDPNPELADYTYENDTLTMIQQGGEGTMVFTRLTDEELKDYEENGSGDLSSLFVDDGTFPEGEVSPEKTQGDLMDGHVAFVGAEPYTNDDGEHCMRFYYDFTNTTDEIKCPGVSLSLRGGQQGKKLERDWAYIDNPPEDDYEYLYTLPGKTIRATVIYKYDPDAGPVGVRASDFWDEGEVYWYVDPQNPPGPPADTFQFGSDPSVPDMFQSKAPEGQNLKILRYEFVQSWTGDDSVRVFYEYTNHTDEAETFLFAADTYCFQDGYSLSATIVVDDDVPEGGNETEEVAPGDSIVYAEDYRLRDSSSPIIIYLEDNETDEIMIQVVKR